jgi:hypothetical protein
MRAAICRWYYDTFPSQRGKQGLAYWLLMRRG